MSAIASHSTPNGHNPFACDIDLPVAFGRHRVLVELDELLDRLVAVGGPHERWSPHTCE